MADVDMAAPSDSLVKEIERRAGADISALDDAGLSSLLAWLGGEVKRMAEQKAVNPRADVDVMFETTADALAQLVHKAGSAANETLNSALDAFLEDMSFVCNVQSGVDDYVMAKTMDLVHEIILWVTPSPNPEDNVIENYDNITADLSTGIVAVALMLSNPRSSAALMMDIAHKIHNIGDERPSLVGDLLELVEETREGSEAAGMQDEKVRGAYAELAKILKQKLGGEAEAEATAAPAEQDAGQKRARSEDMEVDEDEGPVKRARQASPPKEKEFDLELQEGAKITRGEMNNLILEGLKSFVFYSQGEAGDDVDDDDAYDREVQRLHKEGLEQNVTQMARGEQVKEIQKENDEAGGKGLLLVEGEGDIPTDGLLEHADTKETALRVAREQMRFQLHELQAAAVGSVATTCTTLGAEGEGAAAHGVALLSRLMAQSPDDDLVDIAVDICVKQSKAHLMQSTQFALQLLYSFYATLAPFKLMDDPLIQQGDFDEIAASPDAPLDMHNPTKWLGPVAPAGDDASMPPTPEPAEGTFAFRDTAEEATPGDGPTPPPSAVLARYNNIFVKLMEAFAVHLTFEVDKKHPLIADILVNSPSIPWAIWNIVSEEFCQSGDRVKTWVGFDAITEVLRKRPAARQRALSMLLKHALCEKEMVRVVALSFLVTQAVPGDAELQKTATEFAKKAVETALSLTPEGGEKKKSQVRVNASLTLLFSMCLLQEDLFEYVFDIYAKLGNDAKRLKERRSILAHPDLGRLVKRLGHEKLLDCIKRHQGSPLLLHLISVMIEHEKKELHESRDSKYIADQIEQELVDIEEAVVATYNATGDKRMMILLLSLTPKDIIQTKIIPEVLQACRPEHISIAMREAVTPLPHHFKRGVGMTPVEMLLFLHQLTPAADPKQGPTLKQIVIAIDKCILCHRDVYKDADVARALQQLVTLDPLPQMLMRTILQTCSSYPNLLSFVLGSLVPVLFRRKLWEDKQQVLWKGFIKLVQDHQPKTLDVLLNLPQEVLLNMLSGRTQLLRCFVRYLNQNKLIHSGLLNTLSDTFAGISQV